MKDKDKDKPGQGNGPMKPSMGRIVMVFGPAAQSNGSDVAPGVITRVWHDDMVNVTVFPDAMPPATATSVRLFKNEDDAREAIESGSTYAAFWPRKV